jgi:cystathionine beta-lyase/cystathionine gamma-synthase
METTKRHLSTLCVHGNEKITSGPAVAAIAQTSTFVFENQQEVLDSVIGRSGKHLYTRWSNPTTHQVEKKLSAIEGTEESIALSSGMAAISSAILAFVKSGERILSCDAIYGGTLHFFEMLIEKFGIRVDFVDCDEFVAKIRTSAGKCKLCYFETPTNPTLKIVDIEGVAHAARETGIISVIDNTFATPMNQRPYEMGIDIVLHSATKYLGGHSDIIAGVVSGNREMIAKVRGAAKLLGGTMDPFAAFLLDRGLKTLAVRMKKHNHNAKALAERLSHNKRIRNVHYPGLPSHPNHEVAKKQMIGFGGMLSVDLDCCLEDAISFVDSLEVFLNAVSLGGVESLVSIPVLTTHQGIDTQTLSEMGISDSTVRLSIGIEDFDDLYNDIQSALDKKLG